MWMISYAIFGLVAGAIARLLHPGRDPMNWLWTMVLGIAGAELGGWLAGLMGFEARNGVMSWIAAIAGAILLLAAYHMATSKRTAPAIAAIQLVTWFPASKPSRPASQPPSSAPAIPRSIVQSQFIGSRPGWSIRAIAPATSPKIAYPIRPIMVIFSSSVSIHLS